MEIGVLESIKKICEYLKEEEKHYLESDKPKCHIFLDVKCVEDWINWINRRKINDQEKKQILRADIKNLKEKLLHEATKKIAGQNEMETSLNEKARRLKVRQMKNRLKELVEIYKIICEPCSSCDGKGEVKSATKDLDGYDLEDCPTCKGTGFNQEVPKDALSSHRAEGDKKGIDKVCPDCLGIGKSHK